MCVCRLCGFWVWLLDWCLFCGWDFGLVWSGWYCCWGGFWWYVGIERWCGWCCWLLGNIVWGLVFLGCFVDCERVVVLVEGFWLWDFFDLVFVVCFLDLIVIWFWFWGWWLCCLDCYFFFWYWKRGRGLCFGLDDWVLLIVCLFCLFIFVWCCVFCVGWFVGCRV